MTGVAPALRALSEPHRLAIVEALRRRERCVRDLVAELGLAQPLVSHHLAKLSEAGLLTSRQADGYTFYALDPARVEDLRSFMASLLDVASLPAAARPGGGSDCCR